MKLSVFNPILYDKSLEEAIVYLKGLVTGLKVENSALAAGKGHAAAEDVSALIPPDEDDVVRLGNVEVFAVHLLVRKTESLLHALADRMVGFDGPDPFGFSALSPAKGAGSTEQFLNDLGKMRRVQENDPHAFVYALDNVVHDLVRDLAVVAVRPPDKNVDVFQIFIGNVVFGVL